MKEIVPPKLWFVVAQDIYRDRMLLEVIAWRPLVGFYYGHEPI